MRKLVAGAIVCLFAIRTCIASGLVAIILEELKKNHERTEKRANRYRWQKLIRDCPSFEVLTETEQIMRENSFQEFEDNEDLIVPVPPKQLLHVTLPSEERARAAEMDARSNEYMEPNDIEVEEAEERRIKDPDFNWRKWGPYLSDREWCTVREDFSVEGAFWEYLTHDNAKSKAYHYGEDGLLGITDEKCLLCFGIALWNEKDPILKERLYGLTAFEGNHGEDMKECVYYLDSTPTHSYMKALYKYPQQEFPYQTLVEENMNRTPANTEFELLDTGIFDEDRYFDVMVEYAKESPDSILIRAVITNRGPEASTLHFIPQLWYRNKWSLDKKLGMKIHRASLTGAGEDYVSGHTHDHSIITHFVVDKGPDGSMPELLFTNNETRHKKRHSTRDRLNVPGPQKHFKDGLHEYIINGDEAAVNIDRKGSKCGAQYKLNIPSKGEVTLKFRLSNNCRHPNRDFGPSFDELFDKRILEANAFYETKLPANIDDDQRNVARQAYAGLLWNKMYYEFNVDEWIRSGRDPVGGTRRELYQNQWGGFRLTGIFSVADKWEYPWYSNWHMGFSVVQLARVDCKQAMTQLETILKRDCLSFYGDMPSFEVNFSLVTPPITAWAVWKVYQIASETEAWSVDGMRFLKGSFRALTFQFKYWLLKGDTKGAHILGGGFGQLYDIGCYDYTDTVNDKHPVEQTDLTGWSLFYCGNLMKIGYKLAQDDPHTYDEILTRLCETYMMLLDVFKKQKIWNDHDGFFYNRLRCNKQVYPIYVRSISNLVPLFSCLTMESYVVDRLRRFKHMLVLQQNTKEPYIDHMSFMNVISDETVHLISVPTPRQLQRVLVCLLDEKEFLSPFGIRSLSKYHEENPYEIKMKHQRPQSVQYQPGERTEDLLDGNSNHCGPIWINMNYLIIEALEEYYKYFGDKLKVECPTGSHMFMNLLEVSQELSRRVSKIFLREINGARPCHGMDPLYRSNEHWKDLLLFNESFNGDNGKGIGASHATGFTALVIDLLAKQQDDD